MTPPRTLTTLRLSAEERKALEHAAQELGVDSVSAAIRELPRLVREHRELVKLVRRLTDKIYRP